MTAQHNCKSATNKEENNEKRKSKGNKQKGTQHNTQHTTQQHTTQPTHITITNPMHITHHSPIITHGGEPQNNHTQGAITNKYPFTLLNPIIPP